MSDPDFGEMTFNGVDAWDCEIDFAFPHGRARSLAVHVWTTDAGPTNAQRLRFRELKARYHDLWPRIAESIAKAHPTLKSVDGLDSSTSEWVAVHLGEHSEDSIELVYTLELPDEGNNAYFIPLNGWDIGEAMVAD